MRKIINSLFLSFSFFVTIFLFHNVYAENQAYLNCVCKCSCLGVGMDVSSTYDLENYSSSPSCADPANGPCKCEGFGCRRTQFDDTSECAQGCKSMLCPAGETMNAGDICVCNSDSCCTSKYGESYYDSSKLSTTEDTCQPKPGAVWNGSQFVIEACGGDYVRHKDTGVCICGGESCCDRIFGQASQWDGNGVDGCICPSGTTYNGSKCVMDSCPDPEQYTSPTSGLCICTTEACCDRIFGNPAILHDNDTDGCTCSSNATWNGSKCVVNATPTPSPVNNNNGDCYCNGRKLTVFEMLDAEPGQCPVCPEDDPNNQPPKETPTPPEDPCSNGVQDNGEEGIDCGGNCVPCDFCYNGVKDEGEEGIDCGGVCDEVCDWEVTISPKEVEMIADGITTQEFIVTVNMAGEPVSGETVGYHITDVGNNIDDDKEGSITFITSEITDDNGQVKFTYTTSAQPNDYQGSKIKINATHEHGNPEAYIQLTPDISLLCGNWMCNLGETHASCPSDCARDITAAEAKQMILSKYKSTIRLNPRAKSGSICANCMNNIRTGNAMVLKDYVYDDPAKVDFWQRAYERYEPFTCGAFQTSIMNMMHAMRLSNDATTRKVTEFWDYGPVELFAVSHFYGHQAAVIYPKGSMWDEQGIVLDPWMYNRHDTFTVEDWEFATGGMAKGAHCGENKNFPICGGQYKMAEQTSKGGKLDFRLTDAEQQYWNSFKQNYPEKSQYIRQNFSSDPEDLKAQLKYLIPQLMEFDKKDRVRVIINCPVLAIITDNKTGKQYGIDKDGNTVWGDENFDFYQDVRPYGENSFQTYLELPKGDYSIELAGQDSGSASMYISYPNADKEFEIYEYKDMAVSSGSTIKASISDSSKGSDVDLDGQKVTANFKGAKSSFSQVDDIVDIVNSATDVNSSDTVYTGLSGGDNWILPILLLSCSGFIFLGAGILGIVFFKKKRGVIGIIIFLPALCISCTLDIFGIIMIGDNLATIENPDFDNDYSYDSDTSSIDDIFVDNSYSDNSDTVSSNDQSNTNDYSDLYINFDYGFSFSLGNYADKIQVKSEKPDWALASYDYCFDSNTSNIDNSICSNGGFPAFNIAVMNQTQYDENVVNSPMGDMYELLLKVDIGDGNGDVYFLLSRPNGEVPSDAPGDEFYEDMKRDFVIQAG